MSASLGVIGLGVMGSAMSRNLVDAGFAVVGHDIDPARRRSFAGRFVDSVAEVAAVADLVLLSLPTAEALADVSVALAPAGRPGSVAVEMSTLPLADKVAARDRLATGGITLLDAPVSGTGLQAADATLVVYSSGDPASHARAVPVFDRIASSTYHLGPFGNGSRMKFVANLLVAVHTLAAAEAHRLGAASGLDPAAVQEVIAAGVGSSSMFEIRGPMMADDRYEPPSARLAIILKDAGIIADHAREVGATTPLLAAALPWYEAAVAAGLGDLDAAALRRLLEEES